MNVGIPYLQDTICDNWYLRTEKALGQNTIEVNTLISWITQAAWKEIDTGRSQRKNLKS